VYLGAKAIIFLRRKKLEQKALKNTRVNMTLQPMCMHSTSFHKVKRYHKKKTKKKATQKVASGEERRDRKLRAQGVGKRKEGNKQGTPINEEKRI